MLKLRSKLNKNGFTLIEILAAITILGILTGIAVVSVTKIIEKGKEKHYITAEANLSLAGQSYVQQNREALPKAIGQKTKIQLKKLVDSNYIQLIKDYSENECNSEKSYVQIYKYSQTDYSYVAYLDCPNYSSKNKMKDITPEIDATIVEDEDARTAHANITITGNEKIGSYSYIIYKNNKEVKNTGNIQEKSLPETKHINFSLEEYTPGDIKLVVTATNIYGNTKTKSVSMNIADRKLPECIIKQEDKDPKRWINTGSRTITVGCDDGETGSGCTRKEYTKTFDSSMKMGTITIEDESGNKADCSVSVYIDKESPTITVKAYKRNSSGKKTGSVLKTVSTTKSSTSATIDLTSLSTTEWLNKDNYPNGIYYEIVLDDNLELHTYNFSENATGLKKNATNVGTMNQVATESVNGTSQTKTFSVDKDGFRKNQAVVIDAAGNTANVIMNTPLDRAAPTVPTVSMYKWNDNSTTPTSTTGLSRYSNDTWSNKNVYTVASGSTDAISEFKEYQYTTTGETTNNTNKSATTRNVNAEGTSYIKYRSCDNAGNCSDYSTKYTIKIDKTFPTCKVTGGSTSWINASSSTTKRTIKAECEDDGSGCATAAFSYDYSSNINTTTAGAKGNNTGGTVSDNAGNTTNCAANQTVKIDKAAPTCTSSGGNSNWTNGNITLNGTCSDTGGSNCKENITKTFNSNTNTTKASPGTVYDNAGNSTPCPSNQTVKIDKTAPTCTSGGGNSNWTNGNRTLTGTCSDTGGSGCKEDISKTFRTNTNTTAASPGTVYDNAGNSTPCPSNQTVKIDKTAPTCTSSGGNPNWTNGNRTLTGTCSDQGGSGCRGNVTQRFTDTINTTTASPGTVYDNAGNSATCPANQIVRVDHEVPNVCTISASADAIYDTSGLQKTASGQVLYPYVYDIGELGVTLNAGDRHSGINSSATTTSTDIKYYNSSGTQVSALNTEGYMVYKVTKNIFDYAGNKTTCSNQFYVLTSPAGQRIPVIVSNGNKVVTLGAYSLRRGDITENGIIDNTDAQGILRAAADYNNLDPFQKYTADVISDFKINASDSRQALRININAQSKDASVIPTKYCITKSTVSGDCPTSVSSYNCQTKTTFSESTANLTKCLMYQYSDGVYSTPLKFTFGMFPSS